MTVGIPGVPAEANYGDSSGNQVSPGHWEQIGSTRAPVYFVDHTESTWPVGSAVTEWNKAYPNYSVPISVYYRTSCNAGSDQCVHVYPRNNTNTIAECGQPDPGFEMYGCMRPRFWVDGHFMGAGVGEDPPIGTMIYLNTTVNDTAAEKRSTACHELGHALGLGERGTATARANTCMDAMQNVLIPDSHDYIALRDEVYLHSD
ncbi:MAG: hypothetical protein ACT4QF_07040 [Sporichthyaceae bacterium]